MAASGNLSKNFSPISLPPKDTPREARGHGGMAGTEPEGLASKGYEARGEAEAAVRYGRSYSIRSSLRRKNRKCIKETGIPTVTANSTLYYSRLK